VDGDGIPNYLDLDSDNDGVSDALEHAFGYDPYDAGDTPEVPLVASWVIAVLLLSLGIIAVRRRISVRTSRR